MKERMKKTGKKTGKKTTRKKKAQAWPKYRKTRRRELNLINTYKTKRSATKDYTELSNKDLNVKIYKSKRMRGNPYHPKKTGKYAIYN